MLGYRMSLRKQNPHFSNLLIPAIQTKSNCWSVMLFCTYMYFFFPETEEAWKIVIVLQHMSRPRALQHYTLVSCVEIRHIACKFQEKNIHETLVWKYTRKNTRENTRKFGKFACKTLHAECYNLRVFSLLEFLHRWLSECSCTSAFGFNLLA